MSALTQGRKAGARRVVVALAAVVATALAATSCVTLPGGIEVESPAASVKAKAGQTIKVAVIRPGALDPADASDPSSQLIVRTMCDTLLRTDPETGELIPGIVEKWSTSTESGTTRILATLRKDVYFPDGRQVDARAVVDSLSRVAREETAGSMAALFRDIGGYEHIRGTTEEPPDRAREYLTGARVSDPFGIEIIVNGEDASWARRLANPASAIVDDEAGRRDPLAFARKPGCAGPYRLAASWNPGDPVIRLVRNPRYHGSPWGLTRDGAGYAKEILFYVYDTPEDAYKAYTDGWVDIVQPPLAERPAAAKDQKKSYVGGNGHQAIYVGLPWQQGNLFEHEGVRVALSQAIDRKEIVAEAYAGSTDIATSFLPPLVGPAHDRDACAREAPASAAVERARETLASARGSLRGEKVPFYYYDGYQNAAIVTAIAASWRKAFGLVAEPKPLPDKDFLARAKGGFDGPFLMGWDGERMASPEAYLWNLVGTGEPGNVAKFSDPGFDRYYLKEVAPYGGRAGSGLATEEEQLLALRRAERRVCELMPAIPLTFVRSHWLVRDDRLGSARDFRLDHLGDPVLRELWVKPEPKKKEDEPPAEG
ncbi:ABC transporter substrate-binding protein [Actinopolymorpha sp. B9G3]|uniref:ABC transporter substrate-binding protein n=1 Tax=Actinopolymorpha sp. B9G3 TaxID=3158970 RepID=UPI0032D97A37